jgi:hypothetical protein
MDDPKAELDGLNPLAATGSDFSVVLSPRAEQLPR